MLFTAKSKFVRCSPYKLRPLVDVVRGKTARYALDWLSTCAMQRACPIKKTVASAVANANTLKNVEVDDLRVKEIRVDEGPQHRYFKPGAMGRSNPYLKRLCHISVVLESADNQEV